MASEAGRLDLYLIVGDGLGEGSGGDSYVLRLNDGLFGGWEGLAGEVVSVDEAGDTVRSLLDRIDEPVDRFQPDWVILSIGANDVWLPWLSGRSLGWWAWLLYRRIRYGQIPERDLDRFASAYRALIDRIRAVSDAQVLVCTVCPLGERITTPLNRQVARLNGVIKRVAVDRGVPVADVWQAFVEELAVLPRQSRSLPRYLWSATLDQRRLREGSSVALSRRRRLLLTYDGIHFNSRGADLWAATVLNALVRAAN